MYCNCMYFPPLYPSTLPSFAGPSTPSIPHHSPAYVNTTNSALTLEFLETAFYQQGFAQFPDSDFAALGLSSDDITNLKSIGATEQVHVTTLLTAIATAGTQPVAPCDYNFGFTDAKGMVATAAILENVGVSA
jgi:hypothetical protein